MKIKLDEEIDNHESHISYEIQNSYVKFEKPRKFQDIKLLPSPAKNYLINKFSKKEPLGIVYSSAYFRDILNPEDNSHLDTQDLYILLKTTLKQTSPII